VWGYTEQPCIRFIQKAGLKGLQLLSFVADFVVSEVGDLGDQPHFIPMGNSFVLAENIAYPLMVAL